MTAAWQTLRDPDDSIHDWLKSLYTPYRDSLPDPTVLPAEELVEWDTPWSGISPMSFDVLEDLTEHQNRGLGVHVYDFNSVYMVKSTMKWVRSGKPQEMKAMREFVTKTLHENINPVPAVLKTESGIWQMVPLNSRLYLWPPDDAQSDFWVLEIRIGVKTQNSVIV